MALQIESAQRVFKYNNEVLEDPDEGITPEEVREVYAEQYPELTNGSVEGPEISEDGTTATYTFVATKGKYA